MRKRLFTDHGTRLILSGLAPRLLPTTPGLGQSCVLPTECRSVAISTLTFDMARKSRRNSRSKIIELFPLTLQIGARRESIYRPYQDSLFTADARYPPKYFTLSNGNETLRLCMGVYQWAEGNKGSGVSEVFQLKKFDFSIGTRSYLERFFKRTVFHRRITGEIIIQHPSVLPNAARSDLENNSARHDFLEAVARFVCTASKNGQTISKNEAKQKRFLRRCEDKLESSC